MIFKQYYLNSLSQASYLIGDRESHLAAIVDPQRDIDEYVQDLENHRLQLRYIFLTHFHADFVAGHLELHHRTGAEICLGSKAQARYSFRSLAHGYEIEFGAVRLKILETPGHTPESISIVIYDRTQPESKPYAVLTGDTLFVGDVGRPDLVASRGFDPRKLAGQLYDSLHGILLQLPPETLMYPGHGAGSLCGKKLGPRTWSTIGGELYENYALQPMTREAFVEVVTMDQPEYPEYFSYDSFLNRCEHSMLDQTLGQALQALRLEKFLKIKSSGAQIVDTRHSTAFADGHLSGSLNIGLSGRFEHCAGMMLNRETPIVLVANPGQEDEGVIRLSRIGYDHVSGFLKKGFAALSATPELVRKTQRLTASQLSERMMAVDRPHILDVRPVQEWRQRRIDDSQNIPLVHLKDRLQDIPQSHPVVVHCGNGYQSSLAASLLEHHGFGNIIDLVGGLEAWEQEVVNPLLHSAESIHRPGGR